MAAPTTPDALTVRAAEGKLAEFARYVATVAVTNQDEYSQVCTAIVAARSEIKKIGFVLDPGIASAREHLNLLLARKKSFVEKWESQINIGSRKAADWKEEERRKAEVEQRRLNEERRIEAARKADEERREREKQAEIDRKQREEEIESAKKAGEIKAREAARLKKEADEAAQRERERAAQEAEEAKRAAEQETVTVKAAVPVVAGIRARVNWKFRVVDATKLPRQYMKPDEGAIGQVVRRMKDAKTAEALIPGIEVYSEDAI